MNMRRIILDFLRVPHEPSAPQGDDDVRVFRAAPAYMLYRLAGWAVKNVVAGIGLYIGLRFAAGFVDIIQETNEIPRRAASWVITLTRVVEFGAVISYVAQAVLGLVLLRLDFENRWYIVSNRSLRIREGLVRLREQTMTFANVQHVGIRQGPLQRILGIADLEVRTAGGGESHAGPKEQSGTHVAYFRGIDNAELVRDVIRERLRLHKDAGLGDPDDLAPGSETPALPASISTLPADLLGAAIAVADEAAALRKALAPSP